MSRLVIAIVAACGTSATKSNDGSNAPVPTPSPEAERDAKLFGREPATLGTAFAGITLDSGAKPRDGKRIASAIGGVEIELEAGPVGLRAIEIKQTGNCRALRERLGRAWPNAKHDAWQNPKTHVRASYVHNTDDDTCWLRFDRYFDPDAWLAVVPIDLIGGDARQLLARLGPAAMPGDDKIKWTQAGLGFAAAETTLEAEIENGKLVQLTATTETDAATTKELAGLLAQRAKSEPTIVVEDKTTKRTWKSKPALALFATADHIRAGNDFFTLFVTP